jgi:hypothetical protein
MESQSSTAGLIIISKLYQEKRINDEDREKLKGTLPRTHALTFMYRHDLQ